MKLLALANKVASLKQIKSTHAIISELNTEEFALSLVCYRCYFFKNKISVSYIYICRLKSFILLFLDAICALYFGKTSFLLHLTSCQKRKSISINFMHASLLIII